MWQGSITNAITLNRYAYANGNPVSNVDPFGLSAERGAQLYERDDSDDIVVIQEPTQGYVENETEVTVDDKEGFKLPNWAKWIIGGAVIAGLGVATALTGGAAAGVAGFILAGAFKGAVIGAASGAIISGTLGGINSARNGGNFWSSAMDGAATGFMSGSISGAITGAASNAFKVFKASKLWNGVNGKNVTRTPYEDMVKHYQKHVINEGQKEVAKNIVKYSNDAKAFYVNNATSAIEQQSGVFKILGAPGGIYSEAGKILSFWYIGK